MAKQRVFVVDDDETIRESLKAYFEEAGFEVATWDGDRPTMASTFSRHSNPGPCVAPDGRPGWLKELRRAGNAPVIAARAGARRLTGCSARDGR